MNRTSSIPPIHSTKAEMSDIVTAATEVLCGGPTPPESVSNSLVLQEPAQTASWGFTGLAAIVAEARAAPLELPEPTMWSRTDGQMLLYPAADHILAGDGETGKSSCALTVTSRSADAGMRVIYLDFEDNERRFVTRWQMIGGNLDHLDNTVRYICPTGSPDTWPELVQGYDLVVIDASNAAAFALGADPLLIGGCYEVRKIIVEPALRAGAATLLVDHLPRTYNGKRPTEPYGSIGKKAGLRGALYLLTTEIQHDRGTAGRALLTVEKDLEGAVRDASVDGVVAIVHFIPSDGGARLDIRFDPPSDITAASPRLAPGSTPQPAPVPAVSNVPLEERILAWGAEQPGTWSKNAASGKRGVVARKQDVSKKIDALVVDGRLIAYVIDGLTRFRISTDPAIPTITTATESDPSPPTGAPKPAAVPEPAAPPSAFQTDHLSSSPPAIESGN